MKMRKLIFTLTAVVITVSMLLSGCSGSEKPVEPGVTDEVTVPDEVVSGEPVVINYFTSRAPTDDTISAIQQIVEQYNLEGNNIELVIDTAADRASYDQKLRTMVAADKMPTLFDLDPTPYAKELGDSGKLVDMEAFLKEAGIFDDYISVSIEYQRLPDGRIFGLPLEFTTEMTWYNVDIFNKYNLVPQKHLMNGYQ
ncbi:MAG: extracellular solute-binding protein [Anaerolineales bacterium]|nr:extracellular solute-binding protein [Anaerolineales bacterium]